MSRRKQTVEKDLAGILKDYRALCRTVAVDAIQSANYSDTRHYAAMQSNAKRVAANAKRLDVCAKRIRKIVSR